MNRKTRFFFGLLLAVLIFALPLAGFSLARACLYLSVSLAAKTWNGIHGFFGKKRKKIAKKKR